jgi:hypothetical protein
MVDDPTVPPNYELGYRVPDSAMEVVFGCPVYWSQAPVGSTPRPPGPNLLDLFSRPRPPRARGQRRRAHKINGSNKV